MLILIYNHLYFYYQQIPKVAPRSIWPWNCINWICVATKLLLSVLPNPHPRSCSVRNNTDEREGAGRCGRECYTLVGFLPLISFPSSSLPISPPCHTPFLSPSLTPFCMPLFLFFSGLEGTHTFLSFPPHWFKPQPCEWLTLQSR